MPMDINPAFSFVQRFYHSVAKQGKGCHRHAMTVIHFLRQADTHGPPLAVKSDNFSRAIYGHEVRINGPSQIVYSPTAPRECGTKIWIETDAPVDVLLRE